MVACEGVRFAPATDGVECGATPLAEGDRLSVDGDAGKVFAGRREIAVHRPEADIRVRRGRKSEKRKNGSKSDDAGA